MQLTTVRVIGCTSSAIRPAESAISTAPASSPKETVTFFTRGSPAKVRFSRSSSMGSFWAGRTASQAVFTG